MTVLINDGDFLLDSLVIRIGVVVQSREELVDASGDCENRVNSYPVVSCSVLQTQYAT